MSRRIEDLHPTVQKKCRLFIDRCAEAGIDVIITSTLRTFAEQDALYAKGRTLPGPKVTAAKAGESFHNYGLAFDFAPIEHGKIDWNDLDLFRRCGEIGESCGLEWAGRWQRFREMAHLQHTNGLTIQELQAKHKSSEKGVILP